MILDLQITKNSEQFNLKGGVVTIRSITIALYFNIVKHFSHFWLRSTNASVTGLQRCGREEISRFENMALR